MLNTVLVSIESAGVAERLRDWIPDLVGTGLRHVTLFHAIEDGKGGVNEELDRIRPELDRLAVALSSQSVEADVALKRGDAVPWLVALATSRHADLIVVETPADANAANRLLELLEQAPCPVLAMPGGVPANAAGLRSAAVPPHQPA
jgi:hypothetical protein